MAAPEEGENIADPKNYIITIKNGIPNKNPLTVIAANKDTVTFVDGGDGPWYVVFQDPFRDHIISTKNPGQAKLKIYGNVSLGNCSYLICSSDPSIRSKETTRAFTAAGGGIIIDN